MGICHSDDQAGPKPVWRSLPMTKELDVPMTKTTLESRGAGRIKMGLCAAAAASLFMIPLACNAEPAAAARLPSPWVSCSEPQRVAYRVVPPALNPHNAFTRMIKVHLKPGETCADLK
jgi:hypothetical protein